MADLFQPARSPKTGQSSQTFAQKHRPASSDAYRGATTGRLRGKTVGDRSWNGSILPAVVNLSAEDESVRLSASGAAMVGSVTLRPQRNARAGVRRSG